MKTSKSPTPIYPSDYSQILVDHRRGVAGDWYHGWIGWNGSDTVEISLTLDSLSSFEEITVGSCHSPADWVVKPLDIQASWSLDGKRWSPWQSMELPNPPKDLYSDSRRLLYVLQPRKTGIVGFVRLRFICRPTLPIWHPYFGQKAWLMLDEIELKKK